MLMTKRVLHRKGARRRALAIHAAGALLVLGGCDDLLTVDDPEFASPGTLNNAAGVPILIAAGLGDFALGYSGDGNGNDSYMTTSALVTDETYASDTFTSRTVLDQRILNPTTSGNESDDAFLFLQLGRRSLDFAADATERFFAADDPRIARLRALEGFTYTAIGEGFCSGIPFSETTESGAPGPFGQPLTTQAVFQEALVRFDAALAADATDHLAAIGKARALLNLGRFAEAATAVAAVPTNYVYKIEHSDNTARQNNGIFALQDNGRYSVSDGEGGGLPFRSALDPRVPWEGPFPGFDQTIPQYINLRYTSFDSDVPLASGVEARLIEAEAALQAGNTITWLSKLNALRAEVFPLMSLHVDEYENSLERAIENTPPSPTNPNPFGQLAPLVDPGTQAARVDLTFGERAFWMYTTGHRLGDLRRLARPVASGGYGRGSNVFPTGTYHKGGNYGADVAFPITFEEVNNPNFDTRNCSTTVP